MAEITDIKRIIIPLLAGLLSFATCCTLGMVITANVQEAAIRDIPASEVFESLHRDGVAMKYRLIGCLVSFVTSIAGAAIAWVVANRFFRCSEKRR